MIINSTYTPKVKKTERSIAFFSIVFLFTLLSVMGSYAYDNTPLRLASYTFECILIAYVFIVTLGNYSANINYVVVTIVSLIIIANYAFSQNEPEYTDLLKYLGYLGCYMYGDFLARRYDSLRLNKFILYSIVLIPVVLVAFLDNTELKNFFFRSPNGFVFLGVSIATFYLVVVGKNNRNFLKAVFIALFYVLICTSLGVVVAALLSILILNFSRKYLLYVITGGAIFVLVVLYIDIPIFIRIRDVLTVWKYFFEGGISFADVDFRELNSLDKGGERADATSSVWRIAHWLKLLHLYVASIWNIPFGMGAGISVKETGYYPHNCYLQIMIEYGLIVISFFVKFVVTVYSRLKNEGMLIYFILTMLLYHLTENLLSNFPPSALMYFTVGWTLCKYGEKKKTTSEFNSN